MQLDSLLLHSAPATMEGPAILATAVPGTGQWFPQRVEVVGHQIVGACWNTSASATSAIPLTVAA